MLTAAPNSTSSIRTQTNATPQAFGSNDQLQVYGLGNKQAARIQSSLHLGSKTGQVNGGDRPQQKERGTSNMYHDNPYDITLGQQRSQSVADSKRQKMPKHQLPQSSSKQILVRGQDDQKVLQRHLSELEVRGMSQNQNQIHQRTLLGNAQSNKIHKIGVVVNPAFRTQGTVLSLNERMEYRHPRIRQETRRNGNYQLVETMNARAPEKQISSASRNYSYYNSYEGKFPQLNHVPASDNQGAPEKCPITQGQTETTKSINQLSTPIAKNLIGGVPQITSSTISLKPRWQSRGTVNALSHSANAKAQQQQISRPAAQQQKQQVEHYRKGEMMDKIISDRQSHGARKTSNKRSSFNYDWHLSKNGSNNLNRYYQLRDELQQDKSSSDDEVKGGHGFKGNVYNSASNIKKFTFNQKPQSMQANTLGRPEKPSIQIVDQRRSKLIQISQQFGKKAQLGGNKQSFQIVSSRNSHDVTQQIKHKDIEHYKMISLSQSKAPEIKIDEIDQGRSFFSQNSAKNLNEYISKGKQRQILQPALKTHKEPGRDKDRSPFGKAEGPKVHLVNSSKDRSPTHSRTLKKVQHSLSHNQLQQQSKSGAGTSTTNQTSSFAKKEFLRKAQDIIAKSLQYQHQAIPDDTLRGSVSDKNVRARHSPKRKKALRSERYGDGSQVKRMSMSRSASHSRSPQPRRPFQRKPLDNSSNAEWPHSIDTKSPQLNINLRNRQSGAQYASVLDLQPPQTAQPVPGLAASQSIIQSSLNEQIYHADSDDEYEGVKRQIQKLKGQTQPADDNQPNASAGANQSIQYQAGHEEFLAPYANESFGDENQMDDLDHLKTAKNMLVSLRRARRTGSQSGLRGSQSGTRQALDESGDLTKSKLKEFKLATKMSKEMKISNDAVIKLLHTLNRTGMFGTGPSQNSQVQDDRVEQGQNIDEVDTATLLNSTNVSIKNLNHTLMKLVAVQQESILISKGLPQSFQMMDRVPVFLEINATGMPHPARITIRPDPNNTMGIPLATLNQIASNYVKIYASTITKNPSNRNNQLELKAPVPKVFSFHPTCGPGGASCATTGANKEMFDKIYLNIQYDMSDAQVEDFYKQLEHLFPPGEQVDSQRILEQIGIINMQIMVRFPKDKEEMQKKKMAAMMKKMKNGGGTIATIDLSGREGEQKLKEINVELTKYYQEQRNQDKRLDQMMMPQNRLLEMQTAKAEQPDPSAASAAGHLPTDLSEASLAKNQEARGAVSYNQLIDLYALQMKQSGDLRGLATQQPDDGLEQSQLADQQSASDLNQITDSAVSAFQANILGGPVDHIARNAYISSKYKQMQGIRSQLNHDLMHARLHNSQQRAEQNQMARRLKSQQWLNKWDEFRVIKMKHVDRALQILKSRRRIINIISIIKLAQIVRGIILNYELIKAFNMRKFTEFIFAIRMYVRYQRNFKGHYGLDYDHRIRNIIRRQLTFQVRAAYNQRRQESKIIVLQVLRKFHEKQSVRAYFDRFANRIRFVQLSIKELKQLSQIQDNYAILRILQEFMVLKHLYMSQPASNKVATRISNRLQFVFDHEISSEIRALKNINKEKKMMFPGQDEEVQGSSKVIEELAAHVQLYDKVCQMKYKLRVMENVSHQYALLLKYLEQAQADRQQDPMEYRIASPRTETTFTMRQKEMGEEIAEKETELYGVEDSKAIGAEGSEQPKVSNVRQTSGAKKEKKGEPKEYNLTTAYKYLWQLYIDTDSEEFEALRQASMCPSKATDTDKEEFYEELVMEGESSRAQGDKKQSKKNKKEKPESTMLDVLQNEEHLQKLRIDRKNMIQLIQFYNNRPERKILHATVSRIPLMKRESLQLAYVNTVRERRQFDAQRIFILGEDDSQKYSFFEDFRNEVEEKGYDQIGLYLRQYKRFDLFKIIFKVLNMHESMAPTPAPEREKKGKEDEVAKT